MSDSKQAKKAPVDRAAYDAFWGEDVKPLPVPLPARALLVVADHFVRGPLARTVQRGAGSSSHADIKAFCLQAVVEWQARYRDRKAPCPPERRNEILALVPSPCEGEKEARLDLDASDRIKDEAFGRVVDARFRANSEGRSLAFREAILEALEAARSKAPPKEDTPE